MKKKLTGGAVVLAAGDATRFGSDKRHHRLADGRTMLETTLATYQRVFDEVFLVLKPEDEPWASDVKEVQPVYAQESALGMGHSLAAGARAGAARHLDYLFAALADMPHVQVATLERLQRAMTGPKCIVQPICHDMPGHPVGFGSDYFDELQRLTGDKGGRKIVEAHQESTLRIEVNDTGVLEDIDVPP